jgi:RNA polymerase sigma factor (sigma-70 family)
LRANIDNGAMAGKGVAELVAEARAGSAEARDELVRRHFRETAATAAAVVNATEAQDLAQEAFIRAFRNLDLLVDPERFGGWLRRIVVGVSIDWLRTFRPSLYQGWSDADEVAVESRDPSPLDLTLRAEIVERVRAAIDRLPPRYRVPIRLYHLDGLSHARIAAALDVPVGTVRSLVARARTKLTALLPEYAADARRVDDIFEEQVVMASDRVRFLHVANGTSTTSTIEAAGIPGARSIWADPLYEGPVPAGLNDAELLEVRRQFLAGPGDPVGGAWTGPDYTLDPANDMREWRGAIERHQSYDELILWFEHDLFDQLNLIQLLTWLRTRLPPTKPVSLICIGSFPGRPDFKGLGELTPDELASLVETRQRVGRGQYELAERAWLAFRAPTPEALDALRRDDTSALPYLAAALGRFLQDYPWTRDGLSRTERRLLELADGDGVALWKAFPRMHDGEHVYYVTDASLAAMAESLARAVPPLLTLDLSTVERGRVLTGRVVLTDTGRSVLSGELDRVTTCGIDRWLGGVHLLDGGRLWRWDEARQGIR